MKAARILNVRAVVPEPLRPLEEIARNLGWISFERAQDLFRVVDPEQGDFGGLDPYSRLLHASQERLDQLAADPGFVARAESLLADLNRSLEMPRWYQHRTAAGAAPLQQVAYFSPEFGIAQALPQYSGGLGVLAGDHMKAANDLGIPLTGVGLLYHYGYFTQRLDASGYQRELFHPLDPGSMALRPVEGIEIELRIDGQTVRIRGWEARVGSLSLYLLDTSSPENSEEVRLITDRLYGGGSVQRIRQEIVLGIGGIRFLDALGVRPDVFHMNEGHAAFLSLERVRILMQDHGLSLAEAVDAVRPANVFTTHTPVPAGIDRFPRALVEEHFAWWCDACDTTIDELMAIGHEPGTPPGEHLNMAVLALRMAGAANGVSQLHGRVSREMFADLWPGVPEPRRPIGAVTNGVHANTWVSREMNDLLDRHIGHDWHQTGPDRWGPVLAVPDEQLRAVRATAKDRLIRYVRGRVRKQLLLGGQDQGETEWTERLLDPGVLTVGFARRFATYKRADLLLRDMDRLLSLLWDPERPIQFVIAGKAHPADEPGKRILQRIAHLARDPRHRERFVFIEDYDIEVARMILQGADVWLNTPLRSHEACGTSGMKATFNGVLNCSVLDGWWAEMYENGVGWAIPSVDVDDPVVRDDEEAHHLHRLLTDVIAPLYYQRSSETLPTAWLDRIRASMAALCPKVSAGRMMREYVERYYEPAAARSARMLTAGCEPARELVAWKARTADRWHGVRVISAVTHPEPAMAGTPLRITAELETGAVGAEAISVELLHGRVDATGMLLDPVAVRMDLCTVDGSRASYSTTVDPVAGAFGFTVRAVPDHVDLDDASWTGCVVLLDDEGDSQG
jgi:glycogen phosphorylase